MEQAIKVIEPQTGEIQEYQPIEENIYTGISEVDISAEAQNILMAPVNPEDVEIRPDGQVYLPEMKYRVLLNKAFGLGRWGMRPLDAPKFVENLILQTWALYVNGRFVSVAIGEMAKNESNKQMTYGDTLEGTKSVALRRLCKDLGIASELWDKAYITQWIADRCFKVFTVNDKVKPPKHSVGYRKIGSEPFFNETGIVPDSPNKDKYQLPKSAKSNTQLNQEFIQKKAAEASKPELLCVDGDMITTAEGRVAYQKYQATHNQAAPESVKALKAWWELNKESK